MKRSVKSKAVVCKAKPTVEVVEAVEAELYKRVRSYIAKARAKVYTVANKEMVAAYWSVGREIVEKQGGAERAKYGDGLIKGDQRGSALNDTVVTIQSKAMGSAGGFILDHRDSHNRPVSAAF